MKSARLNNKKNMNAPVVVDTPQAIYQHMESHRYIKTIRTPLINNNESIYNNQSINK
jgi:hypothetical protein